MISSDEWYTLVAPVMVVPPWATETVLSPWLAADEDRVSHVLSHVVLWKKMVLWFHVTNDINPY